MMNILIIDDIAEHLSEIQQMLEKITDEEIRCCQTSEEALSLITEDSYLPDILLVDIKLDDINGIDLAKKIFNINPRTQIIFISGYDDYYLDVYDVEHIFFLRKPVTQEMLEKAFERAVSKLKASEEEVFVFQNVHEKIILPYSSILYFEKLRRKVLIYVRTREEPYSYYSTMAELLEKLPSSFVRCHNSYIVNIDAITSYRPDRIMIENHQIQISRKYKDEVKAAFYERLEERL